MVINHQSNNKHKNKRKLLLYQRLKSLKIKIYNKIIQTNNQENCSNNITPNSNNSKILPSYQHNSKAKKNLAKYFPNLRKLISKSIVFKLIVK